MKIAPGNQKAISLTHWKQSKTSTALTLMPHVHLICRKLTSIPCSLIVVNRYQRLIKPAYPLIGLMSINPGVHQGKNAFIHPASWPPHAYLMGIPLPYISHSHTSRRLMYFISALWPLSLPHAHLMYFIIYSMTHLHPIGYDPLI